MSESRRPCGKCGKNRAERFFKSARARTCSTCLKATRRAGAHSARIGRTYGITAEEYATILAAQGGVCAVCQQSRSYRLNVDHCHRTGRVRGLLCRLCNGRLLTAAKDNPATLRRAADYLENPPALAVIGERLVPDVGQDERPTQGLGELDEDAKLKLLDQWDRNLISFAKGICKEPAGLDGRGHQKNPCATCVKLVRHVTECWFWLLLTKSKAVRQRGDKEGLELPSLQLDQVFFIAAGLLDPEVAVTIPEWGSP